MGLFKMTVSGAAVAGIVALSKNPKLKTALHEYLVDQAEHCWAASLQANPSSQPLTTLTVAAKCHLFTGARAFCDWAIETAPDWQARIPTFTQAFGVVQHGLGDFRATDSPHHLQGVLAHVGGALKHGSMLYVGTLQQAADLVSEDDLNPAVRTTLLIVIYALILWAPFVVLYLLLLLCRVLRWIVH